MILDIFLSPLVSKIFVGPMPFVTALRSATKIIYTIISQYNDLYAIRYMVHVPHNPLDYKQQLYLLHYS